MIPMKNPPAKIRRTTKLFNAYRKRYRLVHTSVSRGHTSGRIVEVDTFRWVFASKSLPKLRAEMNRMIKDSNENPDPNIPRPNGRG